GKEDDSLGDTRPDAFRDGLHGLRSPAPTRRHRVAHGGHPGAGSVRRRHNLAHGGHRATGKCTEATQCRTWRAAGPASASVWKDSALTSCSGLAWVSLVDRYGPRKEVTTNEESAVHATPGRVYDRGRGTDPESRIPPRPHDRPRPGRSG